MKLSQKQRVIKRLKETGQITRNECLRNFISRLSAIILELKKDGWDFETSEVDGDYIYKVFQTPRMVKDKYIITGRNPDGSPILELNPTYEKTTN